MADNCVLVCLKSWTHRQHADAYTFRCNHDCHVNCILIRLLLATKISIRYSAGSLDKVPLPTNRPIATSHWMSTKKNLLESPLPFGINQFNVKIYNKKQEITTNFPSLRCISYCKYCRRQQHNIARCFIQLTA